MPKSNRPFGRKALADLRRRLREAEGPELPVEPSAVYVLGAVDLDHATKRVLRDAGLDQPRP